MAIKNLVSVSGNFINIAKWNYTGAGNYFNLSAPAVGEIRKEEVNLHNCFQWSAVIFSGRCC